MQPPKVLASLLLLTAAVAGGFAHHRKQTQHHEYVALVRGLAKPDKYRGSPITIVLDVGSSSVRASCFALVDSNNEGEGREWVMLDGSLQQMHMDAVNAQGEADMAQIEHVVEALLDRVLIFLRAIGLTSQIAGVGFSTFVMNLLGIDDQGRCVTPVYTYAGRRPSTANCARELRETLSLYGSLAETHDRTGTVIHPAYAPAEFLRLHHEEQGLIANVAHWQSISGYLIGKWTTTANTARCLPMSFSEASWTGLFDFRACKWDTHLLDLVHMDHKKMPPLVDSDRPFLGLEPGFAKKYPELNRVPFFLGLGDGAAANIGSKCIDNSRIAVTVGTSAALRVVLNSSAMRDAKVPKGLWCYRIGADHLLLGGALNDGGSVYQFLRKSLRLEDPEIDAKLLKIRPNAHGLTMLPFLSGERAPGWLGDATCTITGINKWTTPIELLHAGMESVALRVSLVYSLLSSYAQPEAKVVASGTALRVSSAWRQMMADAMGKELVLESSANEMTSRGIAMLLGTYLGLHSLEDVQNYPREGVALLQAHPDVASHAAYLEARHEQEFLYRKLYTEP